MTVRTVAVSQTSGVGGGVRTVGEGAVVAEAVGRGQEGSGVGGDEASAGDGDEGQEGDGELERTRKNR